MKNDIQPTLDLFARFRKATDGDVLAASFLTLAYQMQGAPNVKSPSKDQMMSFKEAAAYLGFSPGGLYKIVHRSRRSGAGQATIGPTIRFLQGRKRGTIRFKRAWLDDFIRKHQVEPQEYQPPSRYVPTILPDMNQNARQWGRRR